MANAAAVFLAGVAVGGLAGGLAAAFVVERDAHTLPAGDERRFERLADAVERAVTRAVRQTRAAAPEAPAAVADRAPERTAPAAPASLPAAAAPGRDAPTAAPVTRSSAGPLPHKRGDRLAAMTARSAQDEDARRREWLLRTEESVVAELGAPDEITFEGPGERWRYAAERTGDEQGAVREDLYLDFSRGRVIGMHGLRVQD